MDVSFMYRQAKFSLIGWTVVVVGGLMGYTVWAQVLSLPMLIAIALIFGVILSGTFPTLQRETRLRKDVEAKLAVALGANYVSIAPNIKRSSDRTRQVRLRATSPLGAVNIHTEILEPHTDLTLKSSVVKMFPGYLEYDTRSSTVGKRWLAFVDPSVSESPVAHYEGGLLTLSHNGEPGRLLPIPRIVVIGQVIQQPGVYVDFIIWRTNHAEEPLGETLHNSIPEVRQQLDFEYSGGLTPWLAVPHECEDVVAFAATQKQL